MNDKLKDEFSDIKFHENTFRASSFVLCVQTDWKWRTERLQQLFSSENTRRKGKKANARRGKKKVSINTRTSKHKIKGRSQPLDITQSQSINNSTGLVIKITNESASNYKQVIKHNKINILGRAGGSGLVRQMSLASVCTERSTAEWCLNKPSQ